MMGEDKLLVSISSIIKISFGFFFVNRLKFSDPNSHVCMLAASSSLRHLDILNYVFPHG